MKKILLSVFLIISSVAYSQVDRDFWFVAPFIGPNHAGNQQVIFCITAQEYDAWVTINEPANPGFAKIVDTLVPAGTSIRITINAAVANPYFTMDGTPAYTSNNFLNFEASDIQFQKVLNYGIHITSTADITAYYDIAGGWNMDLYALKGKNALGNEFYCPFQTKWNWKRAGDIQASSQIDIVSADDNNEIFIVVTGQTSLKANCNVTGAGFPLVSPIVNNAGDTIRITLNKGQTYAIRNWNKTLAGALGGTHIWTKDKKKRVAVTLTDDSAQTSCGGCADIIGDQLVPVNICGNKYVVMRSKLTAACDGWYFVSIMYDNTTITINDGTGPLSFGPFNRSIVPSQAVRQFQIPAGKEFVYVETTQPVCILHVAGFGCEVGGAILPPLSNCNGSTGVGFYRLNRSNDQFYMTLMTRHGAQGSFKVISECGDSIAIPASWFEFVKGSGDTLSPYSPDQGWWVLKDAYRQFGCSGASCTSNKVPCDIDGDASGGIKNGIGVKINSATKIINTTDLFHLGIYSGLAAGTNQYGYFSAFSPFKETIVETFTMGNKYCYGDTATLKASNGISYEWWYDRNGLNDTIGSKKYLEPGNDKKAICRAYGFVINPGDSFAIFNFKVKVKRAVCFGDTLLNVKIFMLAPIVTDVTFSKTQFCSGDSITITNNTTGADNSRYIWQYKDNYNQKTYTDMGVNPVSKKLFKYSFNIPDDSIKTKIVNIRYYAVKEHCDKEILQDLTVYPAIKADFEMSPVNGCGPLAVSFIDTSKGNNINGYKWLFGDGDSATTTNATHNYKVPFAHQDTIYKPKLVIKNLNNCVSEKSADILVSKTVSDFITDFNKICMPDTFINVTNTSVSDSVIWKIKNINGSKKVDPSADGRLELLGNISGFVRMDTIIQYSYSFYDPMHPKNLSYACLDSSYRVVVVYPVALCPDTLIKYLLTVNSGTGGGKYTRDQVVNVTADSVLNKRFFKWTGDKEYLTDSLSSQAKITMPDKNISITAVYNDLYKLTVVSGIGSGIHIKGDKIEITSDSVLGKLFFKWKVDNIIIMDSTNKAVTLTMPSQDVTVQALFKNIYNVIVNNGKGDGKYLAGSEVAVEADSIAKMEFVKWIGEVSWLDDTLDAKTKLVIPNDTSLTSDPNPNPEIVINALYQKLWELTVNGGLGSGFYSEGTKVNVEHPIPTCVCPVFVKWTGDTIYLQNVNQEKTLLTMPDTNVTITALLKNWVGHNNIDYKFEVYPVPATSSLHIDKPELVNEISIVNMTGQVLLEQKNISQSNISQLDVRMLAAGIYILQVEMIDGTRKIARVIIAR